MMTIDVVLWYTVLSLLFSLHDSTPISSENWIELDPTDGVKFSARNGMHYVD